MFTCLVASLMQVKGTSTLNSRLPMRLPEKVVYALAQSPGGGIAIVTG